MDLADKNVVIIGLGRTGLAVDARPATAKPVKATSVIQIWLAGGPSHLDSFDPKPDAGNDYCGPLNNPIATNVDGIRIGELLPLLARQADKYSIIRSMTHGDNGHETAAYLTQTGRRPGDRLVFPCAGAVVSLFKGYDAGYKGLIPPYIVLTQSQGRFSEAGFLGARHMPFATGGDPSKDPFLVEGIIAKGVTGAAKDLGLKVPLVVRLEGTEVEEGRRILAESGLAITPATTMADAAEKVVAAARGEGSPS